MARFLLDVNDRSPLALAELCALTYAAPQTIEAALPGARYLEVDGVEVVLYRQPEHLIVAFRGSDDLVDWTSNLDPRMTATPRGKIHAGFWSRWKAVEWALGAAVAEMGEPNPWHPHLIFTGHSLGGALAAIASHSMQTQLPIDGAVTFGAPKMGRPGRPLVPVLRYEVRGDPIPKLPPWWLGFRSFGKRRLVGARRWRPDLGRHRISRYLQEIRNEPPAEA